MLHVQVHKQMYFCHLIFTLSIENVSLGYAILFIFAPEDDCIELVLLVVHIFSGLYLTIVIHLMYIKTFQRLLQCMFPCSHG